MFEDCIECEKLLTIIHDKDKEINSLKENLYNLKLKIVDINGLIKSHIKLKSEYDSLSQSLEKSKADSSSCNEKRIKNYELEVMKKKLVQHENVTMNLKNLNRQLVAENNDLKSQLKNSDLDKVKRLLVEKERSLDKQNNIIQQLKHEQSSNYVERGIHLNGDMNEKSEVLTNGKIITKDSKDIRNNLNDYTLDLMNNYDNGFKTFGKGQKEFKKVLEENLKYQHKAEKYKSKYIKFKAKYNTINHSYGVVMSILPSFVSFEENYFNDIKTMCHDLLLRKRKKSSNNINSDNSDSENQNHGKMKVIKPNDSYANKSSDGTIFGTKFKDLAFTFDNSSSIMNPVISSDKSMNKSNVANISNNIEYITNNYELFEKKYQNSDNPFATTQEDYKIKLKSTERKLNQFIKSEKRKQSSMQKLEDVNNSFNNIANFNDSNSKDMFSMLKGTDDGSFIRNHFLKSSSTFKNYKPPSNVKKICSISEFDIPNEIADLNMNEIINNFSVQNPCCLDQMKTLSPFEQIEKVADCCFENSKRFETKKLLEFMFYFVTPHNNKVVLEYLSFNFTRLSETKNDSFDNFKEDLLLEVYNFDYSTSSFQDEKRPLMEENKKVLNIPIEDEVNYSNYLLSILLCLTFRHYNNEDCINFIFNLLSKNNSTNSLLVISNLIKLVNKNTASGLFLNILTLSNFPNQNQNKLFSFNKIKQVASQDIANYMIKVILNHAKDSQCIKDMLVRILDERFSYISNELINDKETYLDLTSIIFLEIYQTLYLSTQFLQVQDLKFLQKVLFKYFEKSIDKSFKRLISIYFTSELLCLVFEKADNKSNSDMNNLSQDIAIWLLNIFKPPSIEILKRLSYNDQFVSLIGCIKKYGKNYFERSICMNILENINKENYDESVFTKLDSKLSV